MREATSGMNQPSVLHERIPVVDLGPFLSGKPGALADLSRQIVRTCNDTGFLVVANHAVPSSIVQAAFGQAERFFGLDMERKLELRIGTYNIGYLPAGMQTLRTSKVNVNTKPNLNESFYITRERTPDHPDILNGKPLVGLNKWPSGMPEFRNAMLEYFRVMESLALSLLPAFAHALDLPSAYFEPAFSDAACTLRLIRYEPQKTDEESVFGFAPHIDTNFITLLPQSNRPGLEVLTKEGIWIQPPAVPDTFVVNTGEVLARYSNDRFRATPHRVINRGDGVRYSIPFFLGPGNDEIIRCVETCIGPDNPPRYEPISYAEHRLRLAKTNFSHRRSGGTEASREYS